MKSEKVSSNDPSVTFGTSPDKGFPNFDGWLGRLKDLHVKSEKPLPDEVTEVPKEANFHGLTPGQIKTAAGKDWLSIKDDAVSLEALAQSVQNRHMRERGEIPAHYTATTVCAGCGVVPIFEGVGEHIQGCPWCFNRVTGHPIPGRLKTT